MSGLGPVALYSVADGPQCLRGASPSCHSSHREQVAGVPTTPGYYGDETQDASFLQSRAKEIGYPLLIKAVMGS